jgi:ABC-type polar amino acid transport system ATPase subunit
MLKVNQLSYAYSNTKVLDQISFEINQGEIVGLLGPSGSGKTTLMKLMSSLLELQSGSLQFLNNQSLNLKDIPSELGLVFQNFNLFPHLSVIENCTLAYRLKNKCSKDLANVKALKLLGQLGLSDQVDKYIDQCSGGQQQRIAIARALMMDPKMLLIDEPTSSLDQQNIKILVNLLKHLHQSGLTIILITHDENFAMKLCTRVIELKEGQIGFDGDAKTYFEPKLG